MHFFPSCKIFLLLLPKSLGLAVQQKVSEALSPCHIQDQSFHTTSRPFSNTELKVLVTLAFARITFGLVDKMKCVYNKMCSFWRYSCHLEKCEN